MPKKKILVFMYKLAGGGAERTIINIINYLERKGYNIVLILGTDKENDYIDIVNKNITIKFLYKRKLRYCLFSLRREIIKESPDLIFTTMNPNNILAMIAKIISLKKIPIILREANNRTESGKVTKLNRWVTKILYGYSDNIIALSEGVKLDLVDNFGLSSDKIKVIYNPVDIDGIKLLKTENVKNHLFESNEKILISIGRLEEQKDFNTLLKAFAIVNKKISTKLIILGKGSQEIELKQICEKLNLTHKVFFIGFQNNPYKYLNISDLFVLTSRWEGFGHVIVESMAVGIPVISTNCNSGPSEIIGNNEYGILTEVGNEKDIAQQILLMLKDDEMLNYYKNKGLKRSLDFKSSKIVSEYENVFTKYIIS